jgi:hypothetical protein
MPLVLQLSGISPVVRGQTWTGQCRLRIGQMARSNDVVLDHSTVNRNHAEVVRSGNNFFVRDLGSKSGTRVNGKSVGRDPVPLKPLDQIEFGSVCLRFTVRKRRSCDTTWFAELQRIATEVRIRFDAGIVTIFVAGVEQDTLLTPVCTLTGKGVNAALLTPAVHEPDTPADPRSSVEYVYTKGIGYLSEDLLGSYGEADIEYGRRLLSLGEPSTMRVPLWVASGVVVGVVEVRKRSVADDPFMKSDLNAAYKLASLTTDRVEIFDQPVIPPVDPRWLDWNDHLIPHLVQMIAEQHAFDRLPILGDALEDAGCTNHDLLCHCRAGESHGERCWVVDLLLGK